MALTIHYTKKFKNVTWKSGHIYAMDYTAWQNDPKPVILLMYAFSGTHPETNHEWTFFQGINFTYIPRADRRQFVAAWMNEWERTKGNFELTWNTILIKFPYMKNAVRRYFYSPNYYIQNPKEIPLEDIEDVVVSTWSRDFSKKVKTSLRQKAREVKKNIQQGWRTGIFRFKR